ncbi:fungal specific transcription factor factor [Fusarium mundagurra]|uniref:Fungal specific transcription factor factor n=1 Tax=Fusarium mundagurra TaxID=1567541 RepID=A0A8H5XWW8_9HYPO|nr:fungal specific transcription factor factor [Fusarium mundagurra]
MTSLCSDSQYSSLHPVILLKQDLHGMWRTSSGDSSTVQEQGSLRTLEKGKSQFIGSSSGIYFVNTVRRAFINANSRLSSRLLDTTHPTPEECIVADAEDEQQRPSDSAPASSFAGLGRPPQPDVAKQLFMTYFQTWHRFFPFLHGPTILKDLGDLYSSFDQNSTATTLAKSIILQCIFNLASLHDNNQLPAACEIQKPTDVLTCLPGLAVKGDLVSIQALFAAGLLLVARMSLRAAAVVSGLLSRALLLAGLHRCPCRYARLTADDCDIRKRLFWCIYVFDRYLSQALGHPLGIQDSDVDVCPLNGPELHHPLLHPTVPSSHDDFTSPLSGLSMNSSANQFGDVTVVSRQSEAGLGRGTSEDESSQKHNRHSSLSFQVQYSRLLGRALELFHKSLHIRSIDSGSILSLQTDINALWNALPSSLQEFDPSSHANDASQSQVFNESAHFLLLHSQLVLLIHRPRLSLEPSTPEFQSAIQICISEARQIIKIISKQHDAGYALFWPGYLSVTWMAGIVLAFACQLRLYSAEKGKREISMCLEALLHMSERWNLAKNCHAVLTDLTEALNDMENTRKRPAFDSTANSVHSPTIQRVVRDSVSPTANAQSGPRKSRRLHSESRSKPSQKNEGSGQSSNQSPTTNSNASADGPLSHSFSDVTGSAIDDYSHSFEDPVRWDQASMLKVPKLWVSVYLANSHETGLIARAFNDDNQDIRFKERITEHSIGEQRMLALMNHWERFPLLTADDVARWIEEASRNSIVHDGAGSQSVKNTGEASRPVRHSHDIAHQHEADIESHACSEDDLSVESRRGHAVDQGSLSLFPMEISSVETAQAPIPADKAHEVRSTTASSMIELPADFKDQFLW